MSAIQILFSFIEIYQFILSTRVACVYLVSVVHRKEESPGLVKKVPFKSNNIANNSAWQAEKEKTGKVSLQDQLNSSPSSAAANPV